MRVQCFLVERTDLVAQYLRRYRSYQDTRKCLIHTDYGCEAKVRIEDVTGQEPTNGDSHPHDDPRWPTHCACGQAFEDTDEWQLSTDRIYLRHGTTDDLCPMRDLPVGAMFYPSWLQPVEGEDYSRDFLYCPTDNSVLRVITPAWNDGTGRHEWDIDQYCSNCDRVGQIHHCWCRHGSPENLTVDKTPPSCDNFGTCGAGAGSIFANMSSGRGWHGFLKNGILSEDGSTSV